jgi:hypothetical protein
MTYFHIVLHFSFILYTIFNFLLSQHLISRYAYYTWYLLVYILNLSFFLKLGRIHFFFKMRSHVAQDGYKLMILLFQSFEC